MSGENAIPVDALSDEDGAAILAAHQQPLSAREQMMSDMEARRLTAIAAEADVAPATIKTDLPEGEEETGYVAPAAKAVDEQIAKQIADDDKAPVVLGDGLDRYRVKTKIDGVESEVSLDEVVRQYQKGGAADRRLADATRLLEEAKKTVAAPAAAKPEPVIEDPNKPSPKKKFIDAMFSGDEEGAFAAFEEAIGVGRQQPTPSVDELVKAAAPALKQQLVVDSALEKFQTDFADVLADPYLAAKADALLTAELATGKPFAEALEDAGKGTRDWLTAITGVKTRTEPTPTTGRSERLERKAALDTVVGTGAKAVTAEPKEESASDVIAELRRSRGQLA